MLRRTVDDFSSVSSDHVAGGARSDGGPAAAAAEPALSMTPVSDHADVMRTAGLEQHISHQVSGVAVVSTCHAAAAPRCRSCRRSYADGAAEVDAVYDGT